MGKKFPRRDSMAERRSLANMTAFDNSDGTHTYFTDSAIRTMATDEPTKIVDSSVRNRLIAKRQAELIAHTQA